MKKKKSDNKNSHNSPTKLVAKIEVYLVANALELGGWGWGGVYAGNCVIKKKKKKKLNEEKQCFFHSR